MEAAAAATAGAATEFVVCGFFRVLSAGAVRADFVFAGRLDSTPGSAVLRVGPAPAAALLLGLLLVDVTDELDPLVGLRVIDDVGPVGAGWGFGAALSRDPELVAEGSGSGAGAEVVDGYGSGLGDACPCAGVVESAPIVRASAAAGNRRTANAPAGDRDGRSHRSVFRS